MSKPHRSDLWLYERALRQGWDIPAAPRAEVIELLSRIASEATAYWRDRKVAARALLHASRADLEAIGTGQGVPYEELVARLQALAEKEEVGSPPAEDTAWYRPSIYPTAPSLRCRESRRKRRAKSKPGSVPAPSDNSP
jgi:hypothetical protein